MVAERSERILILAPSGRDAALAQRALRAAGLEAVACNDVAALDDEIARGAGAVLIADEALPQGTSVATQHFASPEAPWSALPVIVLVSRFGTAHRASALRGFEKHPSVYFLERPVPRRTLISSLRTALESRRRQYLVRDLLEERERLLAELRNQVDELETLYDAAPIGLAFLDRQLRFQRVNPILAEINGAPVGEHVGRVAWDVVPDLQRVAEEPIRRVLDTGKTIAGIELSGETPARPGVERTWMESYYPVRSVDGQVKGVGIIVEEVTDQRRAASRQAMLTAELNHRVKNMLATVQSVVHQTLRSSESKEQFGTALSGRLQAMARGHDLLFNADWQTTALDSVLRTSLLPFVDGQVTLSSGDVWLRPPAALAFNLILHELATNATKYGALSVPEGHVDIRCERCDSDPQIAVFNWTERGGPPVVTPRRQGFGSRLIERLVRSDLSGDARMQYAPEGFRCEIRFSLLHPPA